MSCGFCTGLECFFGEDADITAYVAYDNDLEIDDSNGNTAFMPMRYCPMCGDELRGVEVQK